MGLWQQRHRELDIIFVCSAFSFVDFHWKSSPHASRRAAMDCRNFAKMERGAHAISVWLPNTFGSPTNKFLGSGKKVL
jgi:hypothetical protein